MSPLADPLGPTQATNQVAGPKCLPNKESGGVAFTTLATLVVVAITQIT
jgi:hypothetical protein